MANEIVVKKLIVKVEGDTSDLESDLAKSGANVKTSTIALGNLIADGIKFAIDGMLSAVKLGIGAAVGVMKTAVDDAISLESAFAGVVKTTVGLADETGELTTVGEEMQVAFRDMAKVIPQDVESLMGLGALGSQLGIQRENLIGFAETMAMIGDATDLTSETAAQAFAQISNVMGTSQDQISNMASALVELGNNMATTEPAIVNFAQRIAGAGEIAGLTESDVFGIAAAFSSVGIEAEAGGSAVQKVLLAMNEAMLSSTGEVIDNSKAINTHAGSLSKLEAQLAILQQRETEFTDKTKESTRMRHRLSVQQKESAIAAEQALIAQLQATNGSIEMSESKLKTFAETAGLSAEEFGKLWEEDAAQAFQLFVEGLGAAGDDAVGILGDLELKDQRLTRAFLSLAGAGDLLGESLDLSSEAFEANTALADEAEARYRTTESQMTLFKNTMRDLSFVIGGAVVPFMNDMLEIAKPIIAEMGEKLPALLNTYVIPALQTVVTWIGEFIRGLMAGQTPLEAITEALDNFIDEENMDQIWNFIEAVQQIGSALIDNAVPAFKAAVAFINMHVMPVFELLKVLWEEGIPLAMQVISDYYETYLKPVFTALVEQWQTNVWPALSELLVFLQEFIPQAIQQLGIVWDEILKPALAWLADFVVTYVIPVLSEIVVWFLELIPVALTTLMEFWTETAWPAILRAVEWFRENAQPIIENIIAWLVNDLPVALEELRAWWVETAWPAILEAVEWFEENALPIIEAIVEWFTETLPEALETLRKVWVDDVWPAIEDAITIAENVIVPIFEEIGRWINDNIVPWIEALEAAWLKRWEAMQETLTEVWKVVEPIWEAIQKWLEETIPKIIDAIQTRWDIMWSGITGAVELAWTVIGNIFDKIKAFLDDLAERTLTFKIKLPDIPDWAKPGSPLPIHAAWKDFAEWSQSARIEPKVSFGAVDEASMSVLGRVEQNRTTNVREGDQFNLEANYPYESPISLIDQVRVLQLENSIGR